MTIPTGQIVDALRLIEKDERVDFHARGYAGAAANEILRVHGKLAQIVAVCDDNADASNPALALKFVREVATNI